MSSTIEKPVDERKAASKWYRWLWFSPVFTVPTAIILFFRSYDSGVIFSLAGSALWHLILLIPAMDKRSEFVRWHGRQALLLAGIRTAVPIGFVLYFGFDGVFSVIPFLLGIWFLGTLLAQHQTGDGKCSLARWLGKDISLPTHQHDHELDQRQKTLVKVIQHATDRVQVNRAAKLLAQHGLAITAFVSAEKPGDKATPEPGTLNDLETIRFGLDIAERNRAVQVLKDHGLVEQL